MSKIIEAKNLKKAFYYPKKQVILDDVNLSVEEGESVAIVGRSGEGKSTLLQILGTLDDADSGSIRYFGSDSRQNLRRDSFGFIFQAFHLLDDFTVFENVLMPARIARKKISKGSVAYKAAEEMLERVGLSSHRDNFAKQLSGGEKQRVAIARALVKSPKLIFADEPTGNLDYQTSQEVQSLLFELTEATGATLLLVTHDHPLAERCNSMYRLQSANLEPVDIALNKV